MNRQQRRRLERAKPHGNRHDVARIPKIILQDRDFSQIDLFMMKLRKGEVETIEGHISMVSQDGIPYRVIPALEGWIEYWRRMADSTQTEYDDGDLVRLKNRLDHGMVLSIDCIDKASAVVEQQRRMFYSTPNAVISSQATTQQIKMMLEERP